MENQNHVHSFVDTVVPATCKEKGYTLHRCECGYEYADQYTPPTNKHSFVILQQVNPTCTEGGTQQVQRSHRRRYPGGVRLAVAEGWFGSERNL